jgi:hypothetical protein
MLKNDTDFFIILGCLLIWGTTIYTGDIEWWIPEGSFHYLSIPHIWMFVIFVMKFLISPVFLFLILKGIFFKN